MEYHGRRLEIRTVSHPIVKAFLKIVLASDVNIRRLTGKGGYDNSTVCRWARGRDPRLSTFAYLVEMMGYEMVLVKKRDIHPDILREDKRLACAPPSVNLS